MTPPPIIMNDSGNCCNCNASVVCKMRSPSTVNPCKLFGIEPVAIRTNFGTQNVFSLPSLYSIETEPDKGEKILGPNNRPSPLYRSIPARFIKEITPLCNEHG